jgi:hypothetical protein
MMSASQAPFYIPKKWEAVTIGLSGLVVYGVLLYKGDPGRGTIAGAFLGAILMCIRTCWPIRSQWWFIITLLFIITSHLVLLFVVNWSFAAQWTGLFVMPFLAADLIICLCTVYVLYCLFCGKPAALFITPEHDYRD